MTDSPALTAVTAKMQADSVRPAAIAAFQKCHHQFTSGDTGTIPEADIVPASGVHDATTLQELDAFSPELLSQTVVIKLNGGLGTSMGLEKAKSLLEVKPDTTFLDLIARQVLHLRRSTGASVKCLFMNSFSTGDDTFAALAPYLDELGGRDQLELMQNKVPKLDVDTLEPISWPENPALEWCPPGHGDIYAALVGSGQLDALLDSGVKYAFISNSDNLGAVLDPTLLSFFAESDAPFMMEVTRRTPADKKGGHLASAASDGSLLLREVAQTPAKDLDSFQDIDRHKYFNTNNIWVRLDVLKKRLEEENGALPLPMIRNKKTVDPRNADTPLVYQLEIAMGAAISCFPGATAIEVPRTRFAPVKTTPDLLALRSDAYTVTEDSRVILAPEREGQTVIINASSHYKLVDSIDGMHVPSLIAADSLTLDGPLSFAPDVTVVGDVTFSSEDYHDQPVPAGKYEG